jgi:hypothetical protein
LTAGNLAASCTIPFTATAFAADDLCTATYYIATHAALDPSSIETSAETATSDGTCIDSSCSPWFKYASFSFDCTVPSPSPSPTPSPLCPETGYGYVIGKSQTLISLAVSKNWGWQVTATVGDLQKEVMGNIYTGAGQNDLSKGKNVGTVKLYLKDNELHVSYSTYAAFEIEATHLYVGQTPIKTNAPGQFGFQHDLSAANTDHADAYLFTTVSKDSEGTVMAYLATLDTTKTLYFAMHSVINQECPAPKTFFSFLGF